MFRELAERAARAGGAEARERFDTRLSVEFKPDGSEVSDADHAAQAAVIACIQGERPNDGMIAEETLDDELIIGGDHTSRVHWAIDPIDGTRNYVRGIPLYVCSVGVLWDGTPIAGAIYEPHTDVMYSGSQVEGATMNGRELSVADGDERTLLAAIPSKRHAPLRDMVHNWVDRLVVRNLGSVAMHFALVAGGRLDAVLAADPRLWDIAAGWLLITAAGGRMTAPDGSELFPIEPFRYAGEEMPNLAAGPRTHARLVASA